MPYCNKSVLDVVYEEEEEMEMEGVERGVEEEEAEVEAEERRMMDLRTVVVDMKAG